MTHRRRQVQGTIFSTVGVLVFIVMAIITFLWANGLTFDTKARTFEQTSVVSIETKLSDVEIQINGKTIATKGPVQQRGLQPGRYDLSITKEGYLPYIRVFHLDRGEVGIARDVVLIAKQPLVSTLEPSARFITPSKLSNGLTLQNGELFDGNEFITRFSSEPLQIHRYNSLYLYQLGSNFHVFIPDTNQDFVIYSPTTTEYVPINSQPSSYAFVINENGVKKLINLTIPTEVVAEPSQ